MNDMLQDLLTFTQKQHDNNKTKAKFNAFIISHNPCVGNQVNIADKLKQHKENEIVMQRSLEKFLPKKKDKVDLGEFITRSKNYEQKRQYNIEQMRSRQRNEENKSMQNKPQLDKHSIDLARIQNNPPLYTRANNEIDKMKTSLNNLRQQLHMQQLENEYKHRNTSIDNTKQMKTENDFETWITWQNEWKRQVNKRNRERYETLLSLDNYKNQMNKLQMSQGSLNILKRNKQNHLNKSASVYLNNLHTKTNEMLLQRTMHKLESTHSFIPSINNNRKYVNVKPRYFRNLNIYINNGNCDNQKKMKVKQRSVDKVYSQSDKMEKGCSKKITCCEHWSTALLRMGKSKSVDNLIPSELLYKLNIMQASAWNENDVNNIPYKGQSKSILRTFL